MGCRSDSEICSNCKWFDGVGECGLHDPEEGWVDPQGFCHFHQRGRPSKVNRAGVTVCMRKMDSEYKDGGGTPPPGWIRRWA